MAPVRSDPPRVKVTMWPSRECPKKPGKTTIRFGIPELREAGIGFLEDLRGAVFLGDDQAGFLGRDVFRVHAGVAQEGGHELRAIGLAGGFDGVLEPFPVRHVAFEPEAEVHAERLRQFGRQFEFLGDGLVAGDHARDLRRRRRGR